MITRKTRKWFVLYPIRHSTPEKQVFAIVFAGLALGRLGSPPNPLSKSSGRLESPPEPQSRSSGNFGSSPEHHPRKSGRVGSPPEPLPMSSGRLESLPESPSGSSGRLESPPEPPSGRAGRCGSPPEPPLCKLRVASPSSVRRREIPRANRQMNTTPGVRAEARGPTLARPGAFLQRPVPRWERCAAPRRG